MPNLHFNEEQKLGIEHRANVNHRLDVGRMFQEERIIFRVPGRWEGVPGNVVVPVPDVMPWDEPQGDLINRLAPPEMFVNEGFFEEKEIIEDDLNEAQNTHTASIHQSVAASALRLKQRYEDKLSSISKRLQIIIDAIHTLPNDNVQNEAAKRAIVRIASPVYLYIEPKSKVSLHELLVLSWLAISDEEMRIGTLEDAQKQMVIGLYEIQRGGNLSSKGIDNGHFHDSYICTSGTFNKVVEKLNGIHPDVEVKMITTKLAGLKLPAVVRKEAQYYLQQKANPQHADALLDFIKEIREVERIGVEAIWNEIQDLVTNQLFEEFGSLYTGKNDPNFIALINTGIYTTYSLPSFQKELSESNGYREYCCSLVHTSYRFFGRAEEYKEDSEINTSLSCR